MAEEHWWTCNACGGTYRDPQADGTAYYHACPPHKVTTSAVVDPVTEKVTSPAIFTPTPTPRNENIRVVGRKQTDRIIDSVVETIAQTVGRTAARAPADTGVST